MSTVSTIVVVIAVFGVLGGLNWATHRVVYGRGFRLAEADAASYRRGNVAALVVITLFGFVFLGALASIAAGFRTGALVLVPLAVVLVLGVLPGCAIDTTDDVEDLFDEDGAP